MLKQNLIRASLICTLLAQVAMLAACGKSDSGTASATNTQKLPSNSDGSPYGSVSGVAAQSLTTLVGTYTGSMYVTDQGTGAQLTIPYSMTISQSGQFLQLSLTENQNGPQVTNGPVSFNALMGAQTDPATGYADFETQALQNNALFAASPIAIEAIIVPGYSYPILYVQECTSGSLTICTGNLQAQGLGFFTNITKH